MPAGHTIPVIKDRSMFLTAEQRNYGFSLQIEGDRAFLYLGGKPVRGWHKSSGIAIEQLRTEVDKLFNKYYGSLCLYSDKPLLCQEREGCSGCQIFLDYRCPLCGEPVEPGLLTHLDCSDLENIKTEVP